MLASTLSDFALHGLSLLTRSRFLRASVGVFLGYFVDAALRVPAYAFWLAWAAILIAIGLRTRRVGPKLVREAFWSVFPFVIGLFMVVRAICPLPLAATETRP